MIIFVSVMVNFNQSSYGVMEDDGTVTIIMILSQPSPVQFQVIISATDFTAKGTCNSYNIGTGDLSDVYVQSPRAYISGKLRVPMLQPICNIAHW